MNGVLRKIVAYKKQEVASLKVLKPVDNLKKVAFYNRSTYSMTNSLLAGTGVIAEFKRASPSKGVIRKEANIDEIVSGYQRVGASAVSVLTDTKFFKAEPKDIVRARSAISIPILRKEFIIDTYQIYESKALGADCILLIAAILSKDEIALFQEVADDLGLQAIVEIYNEHELAKLTGKERIIGVNNRNLDTFQVDINNSLSLVSHLSSEVKITESGLNASTNLQALIHAGFQGFLVGESFMKEANPSLACDNFIQQIKKVS